ncbi:hypothetical protein [Ilumatobacter sp.]|uniref:hypothetical protein n=1 Tax=Ilumatobacter sp. TaxID=1967498 RepID=UPI003AF77B7D
MATTIKVSTATRDRIEALGGATHEETIVAALDALETERFWAQAERAKSWWDAHPDEREAIEHEVAERDAAVSRVR